MIYRDFDDDFESCKACGGEGFVFSHLDFRMLIDDGAALRATERQEPCATCAGQGVVRRPVH